MRNFLLILLLCSGMLRAVNDTSWTTLPAENGTTVKVIGIMHGDLWTWSYKDRNSRNFLNRFDTTNLKHISSVELDTGDARLCDMFVVAEAIIALGSAGKWNASGGMNVYMIDTLGKVTLTDTLVEQKKYMFGFDAIVNRSKTALSIVYNSGEAVGAKMYLGTINGSGKVVVKKTDGIPGGTEGSEDRYQLRNGLNDEIIVLCLPFGYTFANMFYGSGIAGQYLMVFDSNLNRKFHYSVTVPGMTMLGFDVYFDANKTLCLAGLAVLLKEAEKYVFVTALDSTGKVMHTRTSKVSHDCFGTGDIRINSRVAGSYTTDDWICTITDYATLPNGVSVLYLNCAAGNAALVNAWGTGTCVYRMRAVYQVGPDHNFWSVSFLSQHFDVVQAENELQESFFTAGSFFHVTSRYQFGAGYIGIREMLINNSAVVLQNGNNLEVIYVSEQKEVNRNCIKLDTKFSDAKFGNYSLTIPRTRIAESRQVMSDDGGLLMLSENYILKVNAHKAIVIRQFNSTQEIGFISN